MHAFCLFFVSFFLSLFLASITTFDPLSVVAGIREGYPLKKHSVLTYLVLIYGPICQPSLKMLLIRPP